MNVSPGKEWMDYLAQDKAGMLRSTCREFSGAIDVHLIDVFFNYYCNDMYSQDDAYLKCAHVLDKMNYTLRDIENICSIICDFDKSGAGEYLSLAINKVIKEDETVVLNFNNRKLSGLGCFLSKGTVIVEGDAGHDAGRYMKGGRVIVKGSADDYAGAGMLGGKIIICESAGEHVGDHMSGGEIIIKGNVGQFFGITSHGGKIAVDGCSDGSSGCECNAVIYHKGVLLKKNEDGYYHLN